MTDYYLPEKYIRKIFITDLTTAIIIVVCSLSSIIYEISLGMSVMLIIGIGLIFMSKHRSNQVTSKISLLDDCIVFYSQNASRKILLQDVTRLSFSRKAFKISNITGLVVSDKRGYGYVDIRIVNSMDLIEKIMGKCRHLVTKEIEDLFKIHKTSTARTEV